MTENASLRRLRVAGFGALLALGGCAYQPAYRPLPYYTAAAWTPPPAASMKPWHQPYNTDPPPYQPPQPVAPAPDMSTPHDSGSSVAHDTTVAGVAIALTEGAKRLFKSLSGMAGGSAATAGTPSGGGAGAGTGAAETAGAARAGAAVGETAGAAELEAGAGRALLTL
jgi:hypothetical protein